MHPFYTIAVFTYPHEITILKHRLQMAGIRHFFENEATASIVPMYSIALGGIRLKIHPEDAEEVSQILDDLNDNFRLKIV